MDAQICRAPSESSFAKFPLLHFVVFLKSFSSPILIPTRLRSQMKISYISSLLYSYSPIFIWQKGIVGGLLHPSHFHVPFCARFSHLELRDFNFTRRHDEKLFLTTVAVWCKPFFRFTVMRGNPIAVTQIIDFIWFPCRHYLRRESLINFYYRLAKSSIGKLCL